VRRAIEECRADRDTNVSAQALWSPMWFLLEEKGWLKGTPGSQRGAKTPRMEREGCATKLDAAPLCAPPHRDVAAAGDPNCGGRSERSPRATRRGSGGA
jgi:hypothetical protein